MINVLIITGPTATGKTALGVALADRFNGEVVSVDSRQVYKGLDIGTGKDLHEYTLDSGKRIPFHLIDVVPPTEDYNLMRFAQDAGRLIPDIASRGSLPVLVGGTALYLNAFISGYELPGGGQRPELRERLRKMSIPELMEELERKHPNIRGRFQETTNRTRIIREIERGEGHLHEFKPIADMLNPLVLGVYFPREEVHSRIRKRLDDRLANGMIEEVERLRGAGVSWERLDYFGLEYRYLAKYLQGELSFDEMRETLLARIRNFAKRQDIWFRKMERAGLVIHWVERGEFHQAEELVNLFLAGQALPPPKIQLKNIHYGPISN